MFVFLKSFCQIPSVRQLRNSLFHSCWSPPPRTEQPQPSDWRGLREGTAIHTEHKQKAPSGFPGHFFAQGQQASPLETFPGIPRFHTFRLDGSGVRHTPPKLGVAEMLTSVHETESCPHTEYVPSPNNYRNICQILKRKEKRHELPESFLDSSPKPHREEGAGRGEGVPPGMSQLSFGTITSGLRQRI